MSRNKKIEFEKIVVVEDGQHHIHLSDAGNISFSTPMTHRINEKSLIVKAVKPNGKGQKLVMAKLAAGLNLEIENY